MRGRSYSPSPPPRYSRRGGGGGRSPSPRRRYAPRQSDLPTSLLVRNLRHDCRPEDLSTPFGYFGPLKDIYLPKDYYTGQPRGFGFIQFVDPADAADAKYHMDGQVLLGRELTVVFAEENRKKPTEMRVRERSGRYSDQRRSPPCYSRSPRYSRSPPPRHRSRSRGSRDYYSPPPKRRESSRVLMESNYSMYGFGYEENSDPMAEYMKRSGNLSHFDAIGVPQMPGPLMLCGGVSPVYISDDNRLCLTPLCKLALEKYNAENKGANFVFEDLVKSTYSVVAGTLYYITFQAKEEDPSNSPAITFQAKVWEKLAAEAPPEVISCAMKST